jgi:transposase
MRAWRRTSCRVTATSSFLLPPSPREWLPEDHLAWFVIEAVEAFDLELFYCDYRSDGHGRPAHDPGMMVALLLYAYATGVRSSRAIERRLVEDVAFRVIAAGQCPDHATIARFRQRHQEALSALFGEVLALCVKAGLVRAGMLALDSTKLQANASGLRNMSYEQLAQAILEEAAEADAREDELYGERRGDELPEQLRTTRARREWIEQARRELEAERAERPRSGSRAQRLGEAKRRLEEEHAVERQAAEAYVASRAQQERERAEQGRRMRGRPRTKPLVIPERPSGRVNLTDPDSRPVRTQRGFIQGYSAQAAATEDQIVVAADVTIGTPDQGWLEPMATQARAELGAAGAEHPTTLLADAGYWNTQQIAALRAAGIDVVVKPDGEARRGPPLKKQALAVEMRARLETDEGRELYRKRQRIIEPIFGQTKANRGADRFLCRGLAACRAEWRLITATHNLLKLWRSGLTPATA